MTSEKRVRGEETGIALPVAGSPEWVSMRSETLPNGDELLRFGAIVYLQPKGGGISRGFHSIEPLNGNPDWPGLGPAYRARLGANTYLLGREGEFLRELPRGGQRQ